MCNGTCIACGIGWRAQLWLRPRNCPYATHTPVGRLPLLTKSSVHSVVCRAGQSSVSAGRRVSSAQLDEMARGVRTSLLGADVLFWLPVTTTLTAQAAASGPARCCSIYACAWSTAAAHAAVQQRQCHSFFDPLGRTF
eukprot:6152631-Pleurochrysis_carterae.AAC.2